MSSWSEGYVTDIGYTGGVYRELSPVHLAMAGLLTGHATPDPTKPMTYCDLGCGQGVNTNVLAATYPHVQFHANDFNPAHVVGARRFAAEAGSTNVHFYEDSFEEFIDQPKLPETFDIIVLHGIYSWVSTENREFVRRFIRKKLAPGGVVYVSYNALPGWSALAPVRKLMQMVESGASSSAGRLRPALDFAKAMSEIDAGYFKRNPGAKPWLEGMAGQKPAYLVHEYFNENWTLFYHADVVKELGEAKLNYVGTATVLDTLDAFNIAPAHAKLLAEIANPVARETMRDFAMNQQFRRDIFAKGAIALTKAEITEKWLNSVFALSKPRADLVFSILGALGRRTLSLEIAEPIADALTAGPRSIATMMQDPKIAAMGLKRLLHILMALTGSGQVMAVLSEEASDERRRRALAFNQATLRFVENHPEIAYLVSPLGAAIGVDRHSMLFLADYLAGSAEPDEIAWNTLKREGRQLIRDGVVLTTEADNRAELRLRCEQFRASTLPMLQSLQIA